MDCVPGLSSVSPVRTGAGLVIPVQRSCCQCPSSFCVETKESCASFPPLLMRIASWLPPLRRQLATLSTPPPVTPSAVPLVAQAILSSPQNSQSAISSPSNQLEPAPPSAELIVLGLESSADDSCAAVVSSTRGILSSIVLKQHLLHESFGGIHPLFAQKAHQAQLPTAIRSALREANVVLKQLDAVAFTRGPGMPGCLATCAMAAKGIAAATGLPLFGVHHMVSSSYPFRAIVPADLTFGTASACAHPVSDGDDTSELPVPHSPTLGRPYVAPHRQIRIEISDPRYDDGRIDRVRCNRSYIIECLADLT